MDFNKRAAEAFQQILDFVQSSLNADLQNVSETGKTLTYAGSDKLSDLAGQERKSLLDKVPDYFVARQKRLNELITAMDGVFVNSAAAENVWRVPTQALIDDHGNYFKQVLSGIDPPSPRAVALKWKLQGEEEIFAKTLMNAGAAPYWDEIKNQHKSLMKMMDDLRILWRVMTSMMRDLDERARPHADRMRDAMTAVIGLTGRLTVSVLKDSSAKLASLARSSTTSLDDIRRQAETEFSSLDLFVSATSEANSLQRLLDTYSEGLDQLSSIQDSEIDGAHDLYRDMRKDPTDMVRNTPVRRAREAMDKARDKLVNWRSALPPNCSAMQTEGTDLGTALIQQLDIICRMIETIYGEFLSEFNGQFFGYLSTQTVSQLMYSEAWSARTKAIANPEYAAALRRMRSDLDWDYAQDLDAKISAVIDKVNALKGDGVDASARDSLARDLGSRRKTCADNLRDRRDSMRAVLQTFIERLEGSQLAKVIDRAAVEKSLRQD